MRILCSWVVIYCFVLHTLYAQEHTISVSADQLQQSIDISSSVSWLAGVDRKLTFLEVRDSNFNQTAKDSFAFHPDRKTWLKFTLQKKDDPDTLDFLLCSNRFANLNLYLPQEGKSYLKWTSGIFVDYKNRAYADNINCLPISLNKNEATTYYLQAYDFFKRGDVNIPLSLKAKKVEIAQRQASESRKRNNLLFSGLFLGIVLFLSLIHI